MVRPLQGWSSTAASGHLWVFMGDWWRCGWHRAVASMSVDRNSATVTSRSSRVGLKPACSLGSRGLAIVKGPAHRFLLTAEQSCIPQGATGVGERAKT